MVGEPDLDRMVDPKKALLMVVDMQNDFVSEKGALAKGGEDVSQIQEMVPTLLRLIERARAIEIPIMYLKNTHSRWDESVSWRDVKKVAGGEGRGAYSTTLEGTWGAEFYEGISPRPEERVIIKHRYSGFVATELDLILRSLQIENIIIVGVATNLCVETTARDGFMIGYNIVVVEDCTGSTHPELHLSGLESIRRYFGTVTSSQQLFAVWEDIKKEGR
ncbi:MAG: cysteine hydrolase family protein [Dehalococcoidia bacterium]